MKIIQKSERKRRLDFASKLMSTIAMGALGVMTINAAHAQATNSSIVGKAPTNGIITARSETGITRHGSPNPNGRYNLSSLPPGTYLVSLERDGKTLASLPGVPLFASRAFEVDFACDNDQCTASPGH